MLSKVNTKKCGSMVTVKREVEQGEEHPCGDSPKRRLDASPG